jgi:hypothetical protein
MQVMGYLEAWVRADLPDYKARLHAFEHANDAIVRAAQDKNLDGVAIAYSQITISCVQCHKIVREGEGMSQVHHRVAAEGAVPGVDGLRWPSRAARVNDIAPLRVRGAKPCGRTRLVRESSAGS